ncbi:uncharacterized protein C16orf74 homolog isoform 1-T1 [Alca torda]
MMLASGITIPGERAGAAFSLSSVLSHWSGCGKQPSGSAGRTTEEPQPLRLAQLEPGADRCAEPPALLRVALRSTSGQDRRWGWRAGSRSEDENMGLKLSCLKGLKTCVSSENGTGGTPSASSGEKHLHVPSIIVTPPTPTGTTLSRDSRRVGGSPPCSQC